MLCSFLRGFGFSFCFSFSFGSCCAVFAAPYTLSLSLWLIFSLVSRCTSCDLSPQCCARFPKRARSVCVCVHTQLKVYGVRQAGSCSCCCCCWQEEVLALWASNQLSDGPTDKQTGEQTAEQADKLMLRVSVWATAAQCNPRAAARTATGPGNRSSNARPGIVNRRP